MCSIVMLAGLGRTLFRILGRETDRTLDIMVFTVSLTVWKKSALRIELMLVKVVRATAADPNRNK